jgi:AcrR family transcriptional regulator
MARRVKPAQTARSERTRSELRRAALVRFLGQGVEETSAEQIAADAGVSLRTFYRHFTSKHDLLFADYDAGLQWFRTALEERSGQEPLVDAVHAAVMAAPYDVDAVAKIAELRAAELDAGRIVRHVRQVEADFAEVVEDYVIRSGAPQRGTEDRLRITVVARCVAAAVFGAMEVWMLDPDRTLDELARLCRSALETVAAGIDVPGP